MSDDQAKALIERAADMLIDLQPGKLIPTFLEDNGGATMQTFRTWERAGIAPKVTAIGRKKMILPRDEIAWRRMISTDPEFLAKQREIEERQRKVSRANSAKKR